MTKVIRVAYWLIINGAFAGLLYAGFILGSEGAENVALFFAWLNIILSFFMLSDDVAAAAIKRGRTVHKWVDVTCDTGFLIVLIWFGAWATGIFWALGLYIREMAYQEQESLN